MRVTFKFNMPKMWKLAVQFRQLGKKSFVGRKKSKLSGLFFDPSLNRLCLQTQPQPFKLCLVGMPNFNILAFLRTKLEAPGLAHF